MRRLVLFDIDGTILSSAAAGRDAIRAAFAEEFEELHFFEAVRFDGKTDPQIIAELYRAAGRPERATAEQVAVVVERYVAHLESVIAGRRHLVRTYPGVVPLLEELEARDDVLVGLLTGNVVPGARLKLGAAGIAFERFAVGAFGSDSAHRPDLPPIAVARAEPKFGRRPVGEEIVIIGDTPADVTCGAALGVRAIAVATGHYSVAELEAAGAHATFEDFSDTGAVLAAVL
jgi:phosphoglycolate phosphatase-like HAD superfamily hydrolase